LPAPPLLGRPVDIAINHDAEAVAMHLANHPETKHFCQSIMAIDPRDACTVDGHVAKVALAWFSPDCKHHSKAKGGKPREKNIRDLAWVVVHWPERLGENAPDVILLENVEEFRQWGPLDEHGMPIKERQGEEFELWVRRLKRCGYKVEYRELRACDYGAPTSRKRLYLIARRDKLPIVWPAPTHGPATSPDVLSGKLKPYRTAAQCIDWDLECPSIFDRKRPLKETTLRRIAHGTMRYVVNAARPFIVPITHSGSIRVHSADEPLADRHNRQARRDGRRRAARHQVPRRRGRLRCGRADAHRHRERESCSPGRRAAAGACAFGEALR
jgi:DNA (cytosine-5)-methyltransferase 1